MKTEQSLIDLAGNVAADRARDGVSYLLARFGTLCESPIERVMFAAILAAFGTHIDVVLPDQILTNYLTARLVAPQVMIGPHRVDFLIKSSLFPTTVYVVVECDGHDFHERTPEQAERDRSRDRHLQSEGYSVFRFTGKEIWRDPIKCADEVLTLLMAKEEGEPP